MNKGTYLLSTSAMDKLCISREVFYQIASIVGVDINDFTEVYNLILGLELYKNTIRKD